MTTPETLDIFKGTWIGDAFHLDEISIAQNQAAIKANAALAKANHEALVGIQATLESHKVSGAT